jgi:hypothetical protein
MGKQKVFEKYVPGVGAILLSNLSYQHGKVVGWAPIETKFL